MSRGALIVGGSVAGIQAAMDLADSGIEVHLVEPSPFLGNGGPTAVPRHLLNARLLEVAKHARIWVWTNTRVNRIEGQAGRFRIELRQHPRYVDLAKCTACRECIEVCPVTVPGTDHKAIHLIEGAQPGCAVIDKLGKAPCANTCPGGIHVQGYVALIAQGRFQEALDLIRQAIPFPGICGRICTHPCELNCRRAEVDESVSIRLLKRFVADWELESDGKRQNLAGQTSAAGDNEHVSRPAAGKSVAVIGAGPAGMAVADNLVRKGYRVSVFEAQPVVGGMMALGIPSYRLPREVILREIQRIERRGVEICLNTPIGPEGKYTLDGLFALGYDAVFIGVGAHKGHELRIPGEGLQGVVAGIELLRAINLSQQTDDPQWQMRVLRYMQGGLAARVAIIGGGNTAMDVARSLRRSGVDDVRVLYRRTRTEMPAMPEEIEEAECEGIPIEFLVSPVRILGNEQGRVVGLECVRMKLGEPDHSGRRRPVPIAGSEHTLELDMVVSAIGQSPDLSFLGEGHPFAVTREGTFNVDRVSFMTNRPGVFAAGDAITQPVSVIDAIGSAKQAAAGIDAYLRGVEPMAVQVSDREIPIARRELAPEELRSRPRHRAPTIPLGRRLSSHAEVELGYTAEQAVAEAGRCLACGPCSECLACEQVCETGAIVHRQEETRASLEIGAVVYAGPSEEWEAMDLAHIDALYQADPDSPLAGSAAAARAMFDLFAVRDLDLGPARPALFQETGRLGVFVCQCGGQISQVVDTEAVRDRAAVWPGVVHTQVLPVSCTVEAAEIIGQAMSDHNLSQAVLAACSCCSLDQVCYSCTYQRVRCKHNLGIWASPRDAALPPGTFEFVNIREQCAWTHAGDPQAATTKATALVAGAVARARAAGARSTESPVIDRSALILGSGAKASVCREALVRQGITARQLNGVPAQIRRLGGQYAAVQNGQSWQASALVLAPRDGDELERLRAAFGSDGRRPRTDPTWASLDTHLPGVFACALGDDVRLMGQAAAARVAAWLGRSAAQAGRGQVSPITAVVDPSRCRACATCIDVCEYGAPQLLGEDPARASWIDPLICQGCGTCATHCPSGAITAGYSTDAQLEEILRETLAVLESAKRQDKVVVFTCNWGAYSGLESAGTQHLDYSPAILPVKVMCLGRLSPGIILKAFEKGARGVLLLGCPPGECHYGFGNHRAEEVFAEARDLASLLGYGQEQLKLEWLATAQGTTFAAQVRDFVAELHGERVP